ncbi:ISL3 family transposase [Mitsuokella sp. oral taxon 131]|uniref:ISL3 family transposase n=1 Tax=Mitsuokella sp. oral taxon 131 TaxID=1321780 RepID=UPI0003AE17B0|nr:ISL3 family transposase [Mitsuokella sp. oral taxon 131]ERL04142.1 transposase [Mitsuokella sp. oral taxon 131 str. W9106]
MAIDFIMFLFELPASCRKFIEKGVLQFTLPRKIQYCPHCGASHTIVHGYRMQRLRGLAVSDMTCIYKSRRYLCQECGKTFMEERTFIKPYQRMPNSVIDAIVQEHGALVTEEHIAHRHGVSVPTVMRHFARAMETAEKKADRSTLPRILSMDEFRGNVGAKYQVVMNDLEKKQCCAILKDRSKEALYDAVLSYSQEMRESVCLVSMDLSSFFRKIVEEHFPNAIIAADKFHAVRLANDALNEIRVDVQEKLDSEQRRDFKNAKKILLARKNTLKEASLSKLKGMLNVSDDLSHAYQLKEEYFALFSSKDHASYKRRLQDFAEHVAKFGLKEFKRVLRTTYQWQEEIWTGIQTGYNNGFTEGCNNTIKTLKRISYGFRNIKNFRRRILFVLNNPERQARRTKKSKKVSHNI